MFYMKLAVISHKICWQSENSASGYATDGGFPRQMQAISELFSETTLIVPCDEKQAEQGTTALEGKSLKVRPLSVPKGEGWRRKLAMPGWFIKNGAVIFREVRKADAVHAPIPGDVGTIGMVFALILRKPLFVRHCGNWLIQRTTAERFWRWIMEFSGGGRNLMLATGGQAEVPSARNPNVRWIFSTSLRKDEIYCNQPQKLSPNGELKFVIACRQEARKGTDIVIESLPLILKEFPKTTLDVIGGGSLLPKLKEQAARLKVENKVFFHGKVEQTRVVALLKKADLFCYPTSASEGFPKVVLEALACGLPVITTKVSVLPQLIGAGGGILLEQATVEDLVKAISEIASDQDKYEQMSARALETARQYTLENWRDAIGEMMREAWKVSALDA